jgi:pyruvate,water dikinase
MGACGVPPVVDLSEPMARVPAIAGAKAASLAHALAVGFPVLPGFVLTTGAPADLYGVRDQWERLSAGDTVPLIVRSSSTVEDAVASSHAGRFISVAGVRGWPEFVDAVRRVRASALVTAEVAPMAVLVQPCVDAVRGGVLFGLDPVTGDRRHLVVETCDGTPSAVVAGTVTPARSVLGRRGRLVRSDERGFRLPYRDRRRLARLATEAERTFGTPQDIEWAIDGQDQLWLLQARPVTAIGDAMRPVGPLLGPGPVAETFPEALGILERDLFVSPLRIGMIEALQVVGLVPEAAIARSPVVTTVEGRVAADLELLGWAPRPRGLRILNPIPPARHLLAAWRIGRLRRVLPRATDELVALVDRELAAVPPLNELDQDLLLQLLRRVRHLLVSVHGHQILAGMLLSGEEGAAASTWALSAVREGRSEGRSDAEIVARAPVALALVPPAVGPPSRLPDVAPSGSIPGPMKLQPREALRLRARWLDELAARAAWSLGGVLTAAGRLPGCETVRDLTLHELADVVAGAEAPDDLPGRAAWTPGPPLPAAFRLTPSETVVAIEADARRRGTKREGRGAGGGRGAGKVVHEGSPIRSGDVLVVRVLSPTLAPSLVGLAGLVSETGSELSHLAILAREAGVPIVVGMPDAVGRLPEGADVLVDGVSGEVRVVEDETGAPLGAQGAARRPVGGVAM